MYVPSHFRVEDPSTIHSFIRENSFGTLVSSDGDAPSATHLPFLIFPSGESFELAGHLARANPQAEALTAAKELLAIFQGPHAYISPRWYASKAVPTWNYQSVHCYGVPEVISDPARLYELLAALVSVHEKEGDSPFRLEELDRASVDTMMRAIVGFRIRVTRTDVSFKLSQNKKAEEIERIVPGLRERGDDASLGVAEAMVMVMANRMSKREE